MRENNEALLRNQQSLSQVNEELARKTQELNVANQELQQKQSFLTREKDLLSLQKNNWDKERALLEEQKQTLSREKDLLLKQKEELEREKEQLSADNKTLRAARTSALPKPPVVMHKPLPPEAPVIKVQKQASPVPPPAPKAVPITEVPVEVTETLRPKVRTEEDLPEIKVATPVAQDDFGPGEDFLEKTDSFIGRMRWSIFREDK